MRTLSLTKLNSIRSVLFVVVLLLAFALAFAVTARPSHAADLEGDYVVKQEFSPEVYNVGRMPDDLTTEFKLYKVGEFVVGDPYVELVKPYSDMDIDLPLKSDKEQVVPWTKEWLGCALALENNLPKDEELPNGLKPIVFSSDADGHFERKGLENGLYLLVGSSKEISGYPEEGDNSYFWPQSMLVSILDSNVTLGVKPTFGRASHFKVRKVWQGIPENLTNIPNLIQPVTVNIYYLPDGNTKQLRYEKVLDTSNNWSFSWDPKKTEGDPNKWRVEEVIKDDPATSEVNEAEEFSKSFVIEYGEKFVPEQDGDREVITITNKYDRGTLEIAKTLNGFVDNGGESIALTFELSGYKDGERIYHKFVGMQFDANSGDSQTLPVKDIPLGLTRLVVKEVSSSNYTPNPAEQDATPPVENADGTKGPYTVSFTNNLTNQIYNSGIVNKFKLTQNGYEFERQGNGE